MRKTARKPNLQVRRETIRHLTADELSTVDGALAVRCPTTMSTATNTQETQEPGTGNTQL